jgi:fatty-acyl-CoA synthase
VTGFYTIDDFEWNAGTATIDCEYTVLPSSGTLPFSVQHRVTLTNLIPTMLNDLVNHPEAASRDLSSLRLLMSGGAPMAPALVERVVQTFGCDYVQTYGMTETSPYLTMSLLPPHLRDLPASEQLAYKAKTGRPFATVELRVVDIDGGAVAPDGRQVGEIQVRGESVTPGYWNRPDATADAFTDDGFLRTGDLAVVDAEGFVDIVDRLRDMIITGGENVYSTEVEHALYAHAAVLEAAVIGLPDERWGEAVVAAVVLRPDQSVNDADLIAHCKTHLAAFKAPKRVVFLEALPRTGSGKIRKQTLREQLT